MNVVVTCAKRKRILPGADLCLRSVEADTLHNGFAAWRERIEASPADSVPARRLYAGDHWSVVRSLEDVAMSSGLEAAIWVCSTGYGLISLNTQVKPYSATFSISHPDSVHRWRTVGGRGSASKSWWQLQTEWTSPGGSHPRSIAEVAKTSPDSPLLIIASKVYLEAIIDDVAAAADILSNRDLLCIISTGTSEIPGLQDNLLPSKAALQSKVGGSLGSLNARLAREILGSFDAASLRSPIVGAIVEQDVARAHPSPGCLRQSMTDEAVRKYIDDACAMDSEVTWSTLLRLLRSSGRACQQERFARLFRAKKAEIVGI